ncbi:MAG TPA: S41 family peptidase [Candidatus Paceibacterota bacterium]
MRKSMASGVLVGLVAFAAGTYVGYSKVPEIVRVQGLDNKDNEITALVDFEPFWQTWNILNEKYVPADISSTTPAEITLFNQKLVWGAISGMVAAVGDPYTVFLPPTESEIFKDDISGNFEGVGMEVAIKNNVLIVVAPLKGSPAERAGVRAGDMVLEIDGESTQSLSIDEAVTRIRGAGGTKVTLTVLHQNSEAPMEIVITRAKIDLPVLNTELRQVDGDQIFIISLYSFSANSPTLFRDALQEFVDSKTDKLVLDLRGNPGGYLEAAVDMGSWFLPEGKVIVREYFGEGKDEQIHRSRGYDIFNENLKMAILIDGGSASASEILAGALREQKNISLVGQKTFGKGSVQELVDVTRETALKVTVARWLTPNGETISEKGLEPDYKVEITKENIESGDDPQLEKAIQVISNL